MDIFDFLGNYWRNFPGGIQIFGEARNVREHATRASALTYEDEYSKRVPTGSRGALVGTLRVFVSELAHGKGVRLAGYFSRVIRLRSLS